MDTRCFAALYLREVLAVILAHSDNCTTARASRVNSHWSEVALDVLYRRSPDLFDLVSILAPISDVNPFLIYSVLTRLMTSMQY